MTEKKPEANQPQAHAKPVAAHHATPTMVDRDRERLAQLRSKLPPEPQHRTPEEEKEMRALEEREEKAGESEWGKQDARVRELQQRSDHRTPEEDEELARLVKEIDAQDRGAKRAEDEAEKA